MKENMKKVIHSILLISVFGIMGVFSSDDTEKLAKNLSFTKCNCWPKYDSIMGVRIPGSDPTIHCSITIKNNSDIKFSDESMIGADFLTKTGAKIDSLTCKADEYLLPKKSVNIKCAGFFSLSKEKFRKVRKYKCNFDKLIILEDK